MKNSQMQSSEKELKPTYPLPSVLSDVEFYAWGVMLWKADHKAAKVWFKNLT